jgi:serine protease
LLPLLGSTHIFKKSMTIFWRSVLCLMGVTTLVVAALTGSRLTEAQSIDEAQAPALTPLVRGVIVRFQDSALVDASELELVSPRERLQASDQLQKQRIKLERRSRKQLERATQLISETGLHIRQHRDLGNRHHVMHFERPVPRSQANLHVQALKRHPVVAFAEPDELMRIQAMPTSSPLSSSTSQPNDPDFNAKQWFLQPVNSDQNAGSANFQPAWVKTTGSDSVVIAVLDTGIRPHADLQGRLLPGYDFVTNDIEGGISFANDGDGRDPDPSDPGDWISRSEASSLCSQSSSSWHGTFVTGLIGANANNNLGVTGGNWQSKLLPIRVSGKCGAYASNIIDGMRWAAGLSVSGIPNNPPANKARVINVSFGGSGACGSAYQTAVDEVVAAGALVVVAAGNEFGAVSRPGNCQGVMSVGAVRHDGLKANYSNFGSQVTLMAPGGSAEQSTLAGKNQVAYPGKSMWSTSNAGLTEPSADSYGGKEGTSFAAPLVAATASLMLSVNPSLSVTELIAKLKATARPHVRINSLFDEIDQKTTNLNDTGSIVNGKLTIGTSNCTQTTCGAGLLDAEAAVQAAFQPAVNINAPSSAPFGLTVQLDGSASGVASASTLTSYRWTQTAGTTVAIQNATAAIAKVVLPTQPTTLGFQLEITDSTGRANSKSISINVRAPMPPTVLISPLGAVLAGSAITLSGVGSFADLDSVLTSLVWTQLSGPPVVIQSANSSVAVVTTPSAPATFVFRLTGTDSLSRVSFADITVVTTSNEPNYSSSSSSGGATTWSWGLGLWLILAVQLIAFWRWGFFRPKQ